MFKFTAFLIITLRKMFNFFEQPWTLLTAAIIALLVLAIRWKKDPDKLRSWEMALPFVLAILAFGLDRFIQTDTEKIETLIAICARAIEQENCSAIEPLISPDYRDSYHYSKKSLIRHCRSRLSQPLIEKNVARIVSIERSDRKAAILFTVNILFDKQSRVYQWQRMMLVKVKVDLKKQPDKKWLISRIEIVEINRQPAKWDYVRQ